MYGIARVVIRWDTEEHRWRWLRCGLDSAVSLKKQSTLHGTRKEPITDGNMSGETLGTFLQTDLKGFFPLVSRTQRQGDNSFQLKVEAILSVNL